MRVVRISLAVWYDPHWRHNFRRSWKRRRFWVALPGIKTRRGKAGGLQLGPLTFKVHIEGKENG